MSDQDNQASSNTAPSAGSVPLASAAPTVSPPSVSATLPDRLCVDPNSKYFNQAILEKGVGINFNGKRRSDVEEFCISEGWITIEHTRAKDRHGKPLMVKLKGVVEAFVEE